MQPESEDAARLPCGADIPVRRSDAAERNVRSAVRAVAWLAIVAGSAASACGPRTVSNKQAAPPVEKATLKIACPSQQVAEVVKQYGLAWASGEHFQLETALYDSKQETDSIPAADLWIMEPARLPHWVMAGALQPVPQSVIGPTSGYAWDDLLSLYRGKLLLWGSKRYALPLLGDAELLFYRSDLLTDPQHRQRFQERYHHPLNPPGTWQDFIEVAEYFNNQPRPGIVHPCPSLPPLPADDDGIDRLFYSVAVPFAHAAVREDNPNPPPTVETFSFHYDLNTGEVRIAGPGFVAAMKTLQELQRYRSPHASPDPLAAFRDGEAVLCLASPSAIARFQQKLRDKFGIRRLPGSSQVFDYRTGELHLVPGGNFVPYLGVNGWIMVVPQQSAQPDAAFGLAAALSDPRTSGDIVIEPAWGGGVTRRQQLAERGGWQAFDLRDNLTSSLRESLQETLIHAQVINPVVRLRIPDERGHQHALDREVRDALVQGKKAEDALRAAAVSWQKLDVSKSQDARVREYRLSLGLSD
jgi:multiple sugar transport system substrate-binding protein